MAGRNLTASLNDWPIKNLLALSIGLLLAVAGLMAAAGLGIDLPGLRQVAGFLFLTFIPGLLILRILKVHNICATESMVYSAGLSIAFVMFSVTLINFILPLTGILRPISLLPVAISIAVLTLILMAVAFARDRGYTGPAETPPKEKLNLPPVLFLILLLSLTILGVALIDAFQNNTLLVICLIIIAGVVGLAAFGRFIQPTIYPFAIFIIGLCLLYQTTLMSPYPIGSDIYTEYHFYRLAADNGFWNAAFPSTVNSCLSITIMAPVYSLFLGIDGSWLFKAVYPFIFALVPLILFQAFLRQIGPKKAFLSVFFFVSVPTFSLEMIALCRQQVAELFLALVILLLVDRKLKPYQRLTVLCIFAAAIAVSHYALGFIGFVYIGLLLPCVLLIRSNFFHKIWDRVAGQPGGTNIAVDQPGTLRAKALVIFVAVYFIAGAAWYGFIGSGFNAGVLHGLWTQQAQIISTEMRRLAPGLDTQAPAGTPALLQFNNRDGLIRTAIGLDFSAASPSGKGFRILQYITQLFLVIGCLRTILRPGRLRFTAEFLSLSLAGVFLILACLILPYFADYLNITRLYHIALMTLSPFCILGGEAVWLGAVSVWRRIKQAISGSRVSGFAGGPGAIEYEDSPGGLKFITLAVLIPYFLFTSGFIYEVTGQNVTDKVDLPYSIALSSYRLDLAGVWYPQDGTTAQWASQESGNLINAYADQHAANLLRFYKFPGPVLDLPGDAVGLQQNSYIYLTDGNISRGEITFAITTGLRQHVKFADIPGFENAIASSDRIYNNGGAQVLFIPRR